MKKTFLYSSGITNLAKELYGNETIHAGIRPWGMHAGNKLSMIAYPYLLFEELEKNGVPTKFKFYVSLNDWEPHKLRYLDEERLFYNIFPRKTSFQYTPDPARCHDSIVEHYEPEIKKDFKIISDNFPGIKLVFKRNSTLKSDKKFINFLLRTIKESERIGELIKKTTQSNVNVEQAKYAGAICPICKSAQGDTTYRESLIQFSCYDCNIVSNGDPQNFDYWWYHVPLLSARIVTLGLDLLFYGRDYCDLKKDELAKNMLKYFSPQTNLPLTLIAPLVLSYDGNKMSKTLNNEVDIALNILIDYAKKYDKEEFPISIIQDL